MSFQRRRPRRPRGASKLVAPLRRRVYVSSRLRRGLVRPGKWKSFGALQPGRGQGRNAFSPAREGRTTVESLMHLSDSATLGKLSPNQKPELEG